MRKYIASGALRFLALLGMTFLISLLFGSIALANTAGLAVVHSDGKVVVKTVRFDELSISGLELLRRSGLTNSIAPGSAGQAVYMIDGEGDAKGWVTKNGKTLYWALYDYKNGGWQYAGTDAGAAPVSDGSVQAWYWQSYGQAIDFPAVSIPEIGFYLASGKIKGIKPESPAAALPTETVKKPAGATGYGWGYAVFLVILLALAIVVADRLRPRYRRDK